MVCEWISYTLYEVHISPGSLKLQKYKYYVVVISKRKWKILNCYKRSNNSTHSGFEKYKSDLKFIIIQIEQFSYTVNFWHDWIEKSFLEILILRNIFYKFCFQRKMTEKQFLKIYVFQIESNFVFYGELFLFQTILKFTFVIDSIIIRNIKIKLIKYVATIYKMLKFFRTYVDL